MFSGIFYHKRLKFPNEEKMTKLMKESICKLDEKYKNPLKKNTNKGIEINKYDNYKTVSIIGILPFIFFGWGFYQLSKTAFFKQ